MALFNVSRDAVENARNSMLSAVTDRMLYEAQHNPVPKDLESISKFLHTFGKRVEREDAFTLGYFATHASEFNDVFLSHRRANACFNVYAMPKCLIVAQALNGSALSGDDSNSETIAGTMLAIARGVSGKRLANALNDFMNRDGKRGTYSSGSTQSSSACRALEALGVIKQQGSGVWGVGIPERFQRLLDAAHGMRAEAPAHDDTVIDGECEEIAPLAMLPAPDSVTEAEVCDAPAMLALPAPAPATPAKRAPRKRAAK